jgi:hypothetical protein
MPRKRDSSDSGALFRGRIVREQPSTRNGTYRCCGKSLSSTSSSGSIREIPAYTETPLYT